MSQDLAPGERTPHRKKSDAGQTPKLANSKKDGKISDSNKKSDKNKSSKSSKNKTKKDGSDKKREKKVGKLPKPESDQIDATMPSVPFIEVDEMEMKQEIGRGNFGVVFLGKCRGMDVAIKRLHPSVTLEPTSLEAFKKEVATMVILHHPSIVLFMGACTVPGNLAIVTEYLPRGDLQMLIKEQTLTFIQQCQIVLDVASGVQWLHNMRPPIIHRDLKPCNILITNDLHAKIADFGLSITQETLNNGSLPRGTPLWMAPEVLLPSLSGTTHVLSEKIDVYSYGLILWQLFTGSEPYESHKSPMTFIEAVCVHNERPQLPHKKIKNSRLANLISLCWDQDPIKRPSMAEAERNLREIVIEGTIHCPVAADMWKKNWLQERTVPFSKFAEVLFSTLGEERSLVSTEYRCIHRLLAEKQDSSTIEVVSIQRFGLVVSWIGPFIAPGQAPWIKRVFDVMGMPWFHGDIDRLNAEKLLKNSGQKNCWLIRFSLTEPVWSSPFTVSKLVKKNVILHQRVYRCETGYYFYLGQESSSQDKIFVEGDFSKIRPLLLKHGLKVKKGLKNGPYSDLFSDMGEAFTCMYQPTPDTYDSSSTTSL